jgi:hypothetical protein
MLRTVSIALVPAAALLGCTQQPQQAGSASANAAPARQRCFHAAQASNFIAHGDSTVDVQVGARRYYRLELFGVCPHLDWSNRVALVSRGTSWICEGLDAEVIVNDPGLGPQRCMAKSVRPLSDAEARDLQYYR